MTEPCSICSVREGEKPGEIIITDYRKWLCSTIPCPECNERFRENITEFGHRIREKQELAALKEVR